MALINCPECNKNISEKAITCPNCGYPISETMSCKNALVCPSLDIDLDVGERISSFGKDGYVGVEYDNYGISGDDIPCGNLLITRNKYGLKIYSTKSIFKPVELFSIHYKQIESIEILREEVIKDKSVIARAAIGGVVFGPLGAIIGGMTGINKSNIKSLLVLNYWDVNTKMLKTLSFKMNSNNGAEFVSAVKSDINSF